MSNRKCLYGFRKLLTENRQGRFKQWPGLTSSPAIGETIASMMRALLRGLALAHRERRSLSLTTSQTNPGIASWRRRRQGLAQHED